MRNKIVIGLLFTLVSSGLIGYSAQENSTVNREANTRVYSPFGERLDGNLTVSEHQKLVDDKNYEVTTVFRSASINGGEKTDREVNLKSQKLGSNEYQTERSIKKPDASGRLVTHEVIKEEHKSQGKAEEIQRSFYEADMNGKLLPRMVENETLTQTSPKETQKTKARYRPDTDGKFSLVESEEGTERRVSEAVSIKESVRKKKDVSGRMVAVESSKETTTKTGEGAFKKETIVQQATDNGRLVPTDHVTETQSQGPDGVRKYQRLLESKGLNSIYKNLNSPGLILSQRVTGEERKLPDGSIQTTTQIETIDPSNQSNGLRVTETVTEVSKPLPNGKFQVERVVKSRDPNGNFSVSQRVEQTVQPTR